MIILAIDPGQNDSAAVIYDTKEKSILWMTYDEDGKMENGKLLAFFAESMGLAHVKPYQPLELEVVVIEDIESRGRCMMAKAPGKIFVPPEFGKPTRDTLFWAGRFYQKFVDVGFPENGIYRLLPTQIRAALCNDSRANLSMMTTEIIDHFDPNREYGKYGKGTAKNPGPLFGFVRDLWQATAVALAWERLFEYGKIKYSKSKAIPYSADEEGIF